jgi:hypothetical protein
MENDNNSIVAKKLEAKNKLKRVLESKKSTIWQCDDFPNRYFFSEDQRVICTIDITDAERIEVEYNDSSNEKTDFIKEETTQDLFKLLKEHIGTKSKKSSIKPKDLESVDLPLIKKGEGNFEDNQASRIEKILRELSEHPQLVEVNSIPEKEDPKESEDDNEKSSFTRLEEIIWSVADFFVCIVKPFCFSYRKKDNFNENKNKNEISNNNIQVEGTKLEIHGGIEETGQTSNNNVTNLEKQRQDKDIPGESKYYSQNK